MITTRVIIKMPTEKAQEFLRNQEKFKAEMAEKGIEISDIRPFFGYDVFVQNSGDGGLTVSEPYSKQSGFNTVEEAEEWVTENITPTDDGWNHTCWIGKVIQWWPEKVHEVVKELW